MKARKIEKKAPKQFVPFTVEIDVTTEEEARGLYAILNHSTNRCVLGNAVNPDEVIGYEYHVAHGIIAFGVAYKDFYK